MIWCLSSDGVSLCSKQKMKKSTLIPRKSLKLILVSKRMSDVWYIGFDEGLYSRTHVLRTILRNGHWVEKIFWDRLLSHRLYGISFCLVEVLGYQTSNHLVKCCILYTLQHNYFQCDLKFDYIPKRILLSKLVYRLIIL